MNIYILRRPKAYNSRHTFGGINVGIAYTGHRVHPLENRTIALQKRVDRDWVTIDSAPDKKSLLDHIYRIQEDIYLENLTAQAAQAGAKNAEFVREA